MKEFLRGNIKNAYIKKERKKGRNYRFQINNDAPEDHGKTGRDNIQKIVSGQWELIITGDKINEKETKNNTKKQRVSSWKRLIILTIKYINQNKVKKQVNKIRDENENCRTNTHYGNSAYPKDKI